MLCWMKSEQISVSLSRFDVYHRMSGRNKRDSGLKALLLFSFLCLVLCECYQLICTDTNTCSGSGDRKIFQNVHNIYHTLIVVAAAKALIYSTRVDSSVGPEALGNTFPPSLSKVHNSRLCGIHGQVQTKQPESTKNVPAGVTVLDGHCFTLCLQTPSAISQSSSVVTQRRDGEHAETWNKRRSHSTWGNLISGSTRIKFSPPH